LRARACRDLGRAARIADSSPLRVRVEDRAPIGRSLYALRPQNIKTDGA
jgi:hypothetical protein